VNWATSNHRSSAHYRNENGRFFFAGLHNSACAFFLRIWCISSLTKRPAVRNDGGVHQPAAARLLFPVPEAEWADESAHLSPGWSDVRVRFDKSAHFFGRRLIRFGVLTILFNHLDPEIHNCVLVLGYAHQVGPEFHSVSFLQKD